MVVEWVCDDMDTMALGSQVHPRLGVDMSALSVAELMCS